MKQNNRIMFSLSHAYHQVHMPASKSPPPPLSPQIHMDTSYDIERQKMKSTEIVLDSHTAPPKTQITSKAQSITTEREILDSTTDVHVEYSENAESLPDGESLAHEKATKRKRARSWFTRWFLEWWMLEILSWFFGLVCIIVIAVVLSKYDGLPISRWDRVSTSSFNSIFSGLAKSTLLFPTAEGK